MGVERQDERVRAVQQPRLLSAGEHVRKLLLKARVHCRAEFTRFLNSWQFSGVSEHCPAW
jgi:hypothetical protein